MTPSWPKPSTRRSGRGEGNERGAQFLIGVRDGFVAAGRSAAEAEQLVGRYWKAVRDGSPDAVKAIEAQIDAVVKVGQAVQELQTFDSATDQLQQLTSAAASPRVIHPLSLLRLNGDPIPAVMFPLSQPTEFFLVRSALPRLYSP